MSVTIRNYQSSDLPALCALVDAADRHDRTKRALAPTPAEGIPLFLFAPRYPLGTERGLTAVELRGRLGTLIERIPGYVLVASGSGSHLESCAAVYPTSRGRNQSWMLEWILASGCRTQAAARALLSATIGLIRELANQDGPPDTLSVEGRCLEGDLQSQAFLMAVGFTSVRVFAILDRDLKEAHRIVSSASVPDVDVRSYESADGPAWVEMFNAAFATHWGSTPFTLERWTRHDQSPRFRPALSLVAETNGRIIGISHTTPDLAPGEEHTAHLHILGVHPDHQGRGVGRALLMEGLSRLRQGGFDCWDLDVDTENGAAMALYHAVGFRRREAISISRLWI